MPFLKGHIGYNKGLRLRGEYRNCLRCGKKVWFIQSRIINGGGKYCSQDCSNKSTAKQNEQSHNWKKKVGYFAVHSWLYRNFGIPSKCENCGIEGKKNLNNKWTIQWAKLKDKAYIRKRENFKALCSKCHINYDGTSVAGWNKGQKWSKEHREKISYWTKLGMEKKGYKIKW